MIIAIDESGRIVLPERIREDAGFRPGEPLEVVCRDGRVEIAAALRKVRIEQRDGLPVAEPVEPHETLDERTVRETRRRLRPGRS